MLVVRMIRNAGRMTSSTLPPSTEFFNIAALLLGGAVKDTLGENQELGFEGLVRHYETYFGDRARLPDHDVLLEVTGLSPGSEAASLEIENRFRELCKHLEPVSSINDVCILIGEREPTFVDTREKQVATSSGGP